MTETHQTCLKQKGNFIGTVWWLAGPGLLAASSMLGVHIAEEDYYGLLSVFPFHIFSISSLWWAYCFLPVSVFFHVIGVKLASP